MANVVLASQVSTVESTGAPAFSRSRIRHLRIHPSTLAFVALLALGAAIVLYETRGLSFFFDDWEFILRRRGLSPGVLLRPHGPHLSLVPILSYKLLLAVFGGGSYLPFRVLAALDVVVLALVLGVACRRWWGRWWGLVPVLLLVTLGSGAISLLWSFQVGYAIADTAGLVGLLLLTRASRRNDVLACVALIISLASGSQGIGFLVGAAVIVVLRGDWRRSAWLVALPAVLYGLWYLKYGHQGSETDLSLWRSSFVFAAQAFSSTISGVIGLSSPSSDLPPQLDPSYGQPLAVAAIVLFGVAWSRRWRPPPLFWGALVTLVVLWIAASVTSFRRPTDSRYLPTDAMLLFVCLCTALPRPRVRVPGTIAALAAVGIFAATNLGAFTGMRNQMLSATTASRAELGALLVLRGLVPAQFSPAPPWLPGLINDVQARPFYSAVDSFGLTADSPETLLGQDEGTLELADHTLQNGELSGLNFHPQTAAPANGPPAVVGGAARRDRGCLVLGRRPVAIRAAPGSLELRAAPRVPLTGAMERFATTYHIQLQPVPPSRIATVHIPADRAPAIQWRILLTGTGGRVCALAS